MDFVKGQAVSFVIGEGPKGAAAKEVRAEEGGEIEEAAPEEEEGERQLGKVKVPSNLQTTSIWSSRVLPFKKLILLVLQ